MGIKAIFDEIAAESGTNKKMEILSKYKDNELLKRVLYLANSKRIKFYLKQVPEYTTDGNSTYTLAQALDKLNQLIKREVTGHAAIEYLKDILSSVLKDDGYIIERIIDKDCKIGMGTTFMNKVFPKLIEDTPYMGAVSFDEKKARKIFEKGVAAYSQIKMDGRYCNAIIRGGDVELESRSGEATIVTGAKFLEELSQLKDCVLNGELTMDGVTRYESNGIIASIIDIMGKMGERTPTESTKKIKAFEEKHGSLAEALNSIRYTIWDIISVDEYFDTKSSKPYSDRMLDLVSCLSNNPSMVSIIETKVVNSYGEAMSHFQEVLANGYEGTILKSIDGTWKDGKPTWQIKMKLEMDVDLRIVGFNFGTKGSKNEHVVSSFSCESSDGLVKTRPQGLTEEMMTKVTASQEELMGKIIQVKCNGLSNDSTGEYSLMYPSFVMIRDDKDTCDSLESIKQIENMVKELAVK